MIQPTKIHPTTLQLFINTGKRSRSATKAEKEAFISGYNVAVAKANGEETEYDSQDL